MNEDNKQQQQSQDVHFFQGTDELSREDNTDQLEKAKQKIRDLTTTKNINFLFGAGTSTPAIKVMKCMQENFEKIKKKNITNCIAK